MSRFLQFLWLVWPAALGVFLLIIAISVQMGDESEPLMTNVNLGLIEMPVPVPAWAARLLLGACALLLFAFPAFRDYSELFPNEFDIDVYFDADGLSDAIEQFTPKERELLRIKDDWADDRRGYLERLNDFLEENVQLRHRFLDPETRHRAAGFTTFKVQRSGPWGTQSYVITESKGELTHFFRAPGDDKDSEVQSRFELVGGPSTHIDMSLSDIYFRHTSMIRPRFWQMFRRTAWQECKTDHDIIAVTKVRFFPFPQIGKTVYLADDGPIDSRPQRYPIGYCVYRKFRSG